MNPLDIFKRPTDKKKDTTRLRGKRANKMAKDMKRLKPQIIPFLGFKQTELKNKYAIQQKQPADQPDTGETLLPESP